MGLSEEKSLKVNILIFLGLTILFSQKVS
uniref:Uncharacterized protein n=1 Tax=Anguilla anguilla TaxID=7936 RepID=A0A0E9TMG4_ANGAN